MARPLVEMRPAALNDLADIALYLADHSDDADLAFRFIDAAQSTLAHLAAMPTMGSPRSFGRTALRGVRMWRVTDFENYLLFYRPSRRGIEVLRVLHAKRDLEALFEAPRHDVSEPTVAYVVAPAA